MKTHQVKCPNCQHEFDIDSSAIESQELQDAVNAKVEAALRQKELEFSKHLEEAKFKIKEQEYQETRLKIAEREKIINDLKLKLEDASRRAEQGSMQLQGEIQELEIIDQLKEFHATDTITQSKKGSNAADVLQIIKTQAGAEAGRIYYESKRTKTWSNDWIPKFKQDNLNTKEDILVLVTEALPKGVQRYGLINGVWVCGFNDVKELSLVLRYGILKLQAVAVTQQGKEGKMELLYGYLTSDEFKSLFESILSGFRNLQESHQSEKVKMQRTWKERDKIMEQVLSRSIEFHTTIKGIASEVPEFKMLGNGQQED